MRGSCYAERAYNYRENTDVIITTGEYYLCII
jgi:hypothetical protein